MDAPVPLIQKWKEYIDKFCNDNFRHAEEHDRWRDHMYRILPLTMEEREHLFSMSTILGRHPATIVEMSECRKTLRDWDGVSKVHFYLQWDGHYQHWRCVDIEETPTADTPHTPKGCWPDTPNPINVFTKRFKPLDHERYTHEAGMRDL